MSNLRSPSHSISRIIIEIILLFVVIGTVVVWLIYFPYPTTNNNSSPSQSSQPIIIQFPPWWVIPTFIIGIIAFIIILFLIAGPVVLYLRKYYRKFYVPAFSNNLPSEIEKIAKVNPADIQEVVATQLEISSNYYESVLQQSKRSFLAAIIFASVGLCFFIVGITFIVYKNPADFANPSLIGGALTEFLSAINFYLYGLATRQLETFHVRLDGIQRFVIANSVCENLEGDIKQVTRAGLVQAMLTGSIATDDMKLIASSPRKNKVSITNKDAVRNNNFQRTRGRMARQEYNND